MNLLENAILFAVKAHEGQKRKASGVPYIVHPLEVVNIIATMTPDLETMAAGALHDTVEDCDVDPKELKRLFGARVSALVQSESEDKLSERPAADTWVERKEESLIMLENTSDKGVKILWLADKLSNIRSFGRLYRLEGDKMWNHFNQKDKSKQEWYYRTAERLLSELSDTDAYKEFSLWLDEIFGEKK